MNKKTKETASTDDAATSEPASSVPTISSVQDYLLFGLSLPERALRSTAAVFGGALTESASLLLPQAFRDSTSYKTFVQQMLDMVVRDVGGVRNSDENDAESKEVENYVAKKSVGSFIDLAGMATLHVSPIVILAVVSDLAYGSKTYLDELSAELKRDGIIDEDSTINGAADLLDAIGSATSETAAVFDQPPISVDGLHKVIEETSESVAKIDPTKIIPMSEIDSLWEDMNQLAGQQNVSLFELSSAMTLYTLNQVETVTQGTLTTIMVTGELLTRHIFKHYWDGLNEISDRGIYTIVSESSAPYIDAVWQNFSSTRPTITEDLMSGRLVGKLISGVQDWIPLGYGANEDETASEPADDEE